jgi:hypothetical protein
MQIQAEIEDSTHLKLRKPLNAEVGSIIFLEIVDEPERADFLAMSAASLERAYSDDEPDYSDAGTPIQGD